MGRVKRIWYLSHMRAAKVQASLRIRAVSPEPPLLAHTSSESRGAFRQKARSLAPLNGWACAVKICHDGMLEDTNSLDGAHIFPIFNNNTYCDTVFVLCILVLNIPATKRQCRWNTAGLKRLQYYLYNCIPIICLSGVQPNVTSNFPSLYKISHRSHNYKVSLQCGFSHERQHSTVDQKLCCSKNKSTPSCFAAK